MNAGELDASILFINKTKLPFLVSHEDVDWLSQFTWHLTYKGYVATNIKQPNGSYKAKHLQRMLMEVSGDMVVDHINGSKLDNRRENLRVLSNADNCAGSRNPQQNLSGTRGVHKHGKGWCAVYRKKHIGKYASVDEAKQAWIDHVKVANPILIEALKND
jgi:hypothetical protein